MTVHHFTFHITDKSDASDIREVETRAFGFSKEADLVTSLLEVDWPPESPDNQYHLNK